MDKIAGVAAEQQSSNMDDFFRQNLALLKGSEGGESMNIEDIRKRYLAQEAYRQKVREALSAPRVPSPRLEAIKAEQDAFLAEQEDLYQRIQAGELKPCPNCRVAKPPTPEYFRRNASTASGLDCYCKDCRKIYMRGYRQIYRLWLRRCERNYRQTRRFLRMDFEAASLPFVPKAKEKRCPRCQELKPLTREYYHRALSRPDGFQTYCKACRRSGGV